VGLKVALEPEFRAQVWQHSGKWHATVLYAEAGHIVARHGVRFTPSSDLHDVAAFVGFAWAAFLVADASLDPFDVTTQCVEQAELL